MQCECIACLSKYILVRRQLSNIQLISHWIYGESQFTHSVSTWCWFALVFVISYIYFVSLFLMSNQLSTVNSRYVEYLVSRTLPYLEQFIRPLCHLALDQSKKLSVSRISISRTIFSCHLEIFSKFPKLIETAILKLVFSAPASTVAVLVQTRMRL